MTSLSVPDVTGMDTLTAALAYAAAGWYLGPVNPRTKHAGSVLGKNWPAKTSRDPAQIAAWYAGTSHGIMLHAGRSGAVIFDVDHPDRLPPAMAEAFSSAPGPFQSTRTAEPHRGHYPYLVPDGRMLGNSSGQLGKGWGEVRGRNGIIIAEPTPHENPGGRYTWLATGLIPVLPATLAELMPDALTSEDAASDTEVATFTTCHVTGSRPRLMLGPIHRFQAQVAEGEARHNAAVASTVWAAKEARAGYYPAAPAFQAIGHLFKTALNGDRPSEYNGIVAYAVGQANAADLAEIKAIAERDDPRPFASGTPTEAKLSLFIGQLREWLDIPDLAHIFLTLAAAATRDLGGEPAWLLLVAAPSSGKTETIRLLDICADGRLNEVTAAGLLGWSKGKEARPSGVLSRIGHCGLVTFGDLSSLLATSDKGGRDVVFGMLRRAYDGHVTRDISPPGKPAPGAPEQLSWHGRLTVVAAVTGAIDRYSVHADQLGPRWVYTRIPELDAETKRKASDRARKGGLDDYRKTARHAAAELIKDATGKVPDDICDDIFSVIKEAALVTCWGRAAVPRHGYGRREIDGIPVVESPPRLVRQLHTLARGLAALGLPDDYTGGLIRRVALDSMPEDRCAVLAALSTGEVLTTSGLARKAKLDRKVARMRAEELEAVGVVQSLRDGGDEDDEENDRRPVSWRLVSSEDGQVIAAVLRDHETWAAQGWDEKWSTHTPPPKNQGK